jgi:hypothetical protein
MKFSILSVATVFSLVLFLLQKNCKLTNLLKQEKK